MSETQTLLADYTQNGSEAAFHELVRRYVDLVYSAALRLVENDAHLAQDVTQTVFADLARMARGFSRGVMLGGWLHRHTCFVASKALRTERRRKARERIAVEMNSTENDARFESLAPHLDEAINQLRSEDRQAILLRYFEQQDFRAVGASLGSNEEAARKRVHRALGKLQLLLRRRGITLSASALGTALGTQAVIAAPAGVAASAAAAALAASSVGTASALTLFAIMNKTQIGIAAAAALALAIPLTLQTREKARLRAENEALRQQVQQLVHVTEENQSLSNRLARVSAAPPPSPASSPEQTLELMRLRGEVGRLRQATNAPRPSGPSALSGLTANPEMTKVIRQQQKMGMKMVYKDLAQKLKLSEEQTEKLSDMLADDVMHNIDQITAVLREGKSAVEMDQVFAAQEQALQEKVREMLGDEGLAQYQDYNRNLLSYLTAEQFGSMLTGEKEAKAAKLKQLYQTMREESGRTLAGAGLSPDFQLVPTLNFRNFASEEMAERNLGLIDSVYAQTASRAAAFLTPEEAKKFAEFQSMAVHGNRAALAMNRKMMSPEAK